MAPTMKVREVIRLIEKDGWHLVASKGSHMHYKHEIKPGRVMIAGKPSKDMARGTLIAILKQAGLRD
jgi:predicted RNA binding protein YcfA (HicA-like mRNA interferase family)